MDDVRTDVSYRSKRYPILHFGLGNTDSVDVVISKGNSVYLVNGLPVNQLHQIYLSEITGIDELYKSNSIKIYPNPVNDILNIVHNFTYDLTFTLYNSSGQLLKTGIVHNQIDVSSLKSSFYFLKLTVRTGKSYINRFIKE